MSKGHWLVVFALAAVAVSCSGDGDRIAELEAGAEQLRAENTLLAEQLETATNELDTVTAELTDTKTQLEELEFDFEGVSADLEAAEGARETAERERDIARADVEELLVRFDPEIQAAIVGLQQSAEAEACTTATQKGLEGAAQPNALSSLDRAVAALPPGISVEAALAAVNKEQITSVATFCYADGQAQAAALRLVQPFGDGFWTVGVEVAAGRWRSNGSGDGCYWKISPDGAPNDIIDNHFGNAGGTVTIRNGQEFESDDCGLWEFLG